MEITVKVETENKTNWGTTYRVSEMAQVVSPKSEKEHAIAAIESLLKKMKEEVKEGVVQVNDSGYLTVDGLKTYVDQLIVVESRGAYLRVKDKDTGFEYEIRKVESQ